VSARPRTTRATNASGPTIKATRKPKSLAHAKPNPTPNAKANTKPKDLAQGASAKAGGEKSRDREKTAEHILAAVGEVLTTRGFRELGINAVARQAGVDKVLIYRYFGGLSGLLQAFAEDGDRWPTAREIAGDTSANTDTAGLAEGLLRFARLLRDRPDTQAILRWELYERNELVDALAAKRERMGRALLARIEAPEETDIAALTTIVAAGLTYLVLRAKTADEYNGIALRTEQGWRRLEEAVRVLLAPTRFSAPAATSAPRKPRKLGKVRPKAD
jgi:AcrR family transcriptional regulator